MEERLETIIETQQRIVSDMLTTVQAQIRELQGQNAALENRIHCAERALLLLNKCFNDHDKFGDYCPHTGK